MTYRWLNFFFHFSGYVFDLKQRIFNNESLIKTVFLSIWLVLVEIGFAIISLPMYLLVAPYKVQEDGTVFPSKNKVKIELQTYAMRRKISLATILSAGGLFLFKVILLAAVSLYLFGVQTLLAATQNWTFDTSSDYTYDSAKIEVTGGVARLKDLGNTTTGSTTNSGFDTGSTGWTYADWLNGGGAAGTYQSSGGNPGGYVRVTLNPGANKTTAGLWRQSFTTTVNNPDTATLNLDWSSITYSVPASPTSYKLYAFIDTVSGNPTLGTEVWSSPEITNTTSWASVATIDITSKVATAGTYYLKIAARSVTPGTSGTYNTVAGFDNVIVNWSKTTHSYDTSQPTVKPNSSLTMNKTVSWNVFTETATKNGGEIYYQLSSDNGTTWKYWNGSAWVTSTPTNYNTATVINTNIATFSTSSNQILW